MSAINQLLNGGNFTDNFTLFVIQLTVVVIAISIHEFAHAISAYKLGDITPKLQGRITLNPVAHLDLWGFLLIAIVGLGWGRPVEFNPNNFKNPRKYTSLVAIAGPISNIIMAVITALLMSVLEVQPYTMLWLILNNFLVINLVLAVFNMIPLFPLDGFNFLSGILPINLAYQFEETRKYGIIVLIALMLTGQVTNVITVFVSGFIGILGLVL